MVAWVPGVPVVPVSPWLVEDLDFDSLSVSDCQFVVSQSFSFSRKRRAFLVESQGDMSMGGSPEDVLSLSRGRTQEVDCGVEQEGCALPIGRKRDAELPGPQVKY